MRTTSFGRRVCLAVSQIALAGCAAPSAVVGAVTAFTAVTAVTAAAAAPLPRAGNPVFAGWYADPEAHVFAGEYWIYPTYSAPYDQQVHLDAFSSRDLVTWTKHARIVDPSAVTWARRAMWAKPIDQMVFRDPASGAYYIVDGGWRHCNVARPNDDRTGFVPFADGTTFREITPTGYVEGAFMLPRDGRYYFMWSEGGWTGPDYAVAYAVGDSPFGPFERVGKILQQDPTVATGAGHHSVIQSPTSGNWYIVHHRRPLGETDRNHRVVSIGELHFDASGRITPVRITTEGVAADPIGRS